VLTTDRVAGGALVLVGLVAIREGLAFPLGTVARPGPAAMPVVLGGLLVLFGLLVAVRDAGSRRLAEVGWPEWRHAAAIAIAAAFAAWGLDRLGYRITVAAVMLFLLGVLERQRLVVTLTMTALVALGSYLLFDTLLRVPLPRGPFGI
jgi:putative tricarboxylic transport membrane protein